MPKISRRASENISLVFVSAFIVFLALAMIVLPLFFEKAPLLQMMCGYFGEHDIGVLQGETVFWVWIYAIMAIAEACAVTILLLLFRVRKGLVFTARSVAYIRYVSWGCMLIALLCLIATYYFHMAYFISLAAIFLGLCLRVVKNVIEEATAIKNENDYTI